MSVMRVLMSVLRNSSIHSQHIMSHKILLVSNSREFKMTHEYYIAFLMSILF